MKMRLPCRRVNLARVSCALSFTTILFGMIALFSSHWAGAGEIHVGLVSGCYGDLCSSTIGYIPKDYKATFVAAVIILFFMPLFMILAAAILQAITVIKGPQKHRDLSGLILAWLSGYHCILLSLLLIGAASAIPSSPESDIHTAAPYNIPVTTTTQDPYGSDFGMVKEEHVYSQTSYYSGGGGDSASVFSSSKVGWSAYFGLLAALLSLASAVSASLYYGKSEKEECEDTIPLQPNVV